MSGYDPCARGMRVDERDMQPYPAKASDAFKVRDVTTGELFRFADEGAWRWFWLLSGWEVERQRWPDRSTAARYRWMRLTFGGNWGRVW